MRGGRVVERIELVGAEARRLDGRRRRDASVEPTTAPSATCCRRRCSSSTPTAPPPPEVHVPVPFPRRRRGAARGLALGRRPDAACGSSCRSAARSAACSTWPSRNAQVAYQARFNENVAAHYDALETLRVVLALPSVPRRIECFDISTIQGSETVASMVVCEDGRMKTGGIPEVPDPGSRLAVAVARAIRGCRAMR